MSFIDILLMLLVLAITATSFFHGTIRVIVALITFYASIVLASLYFRFLAVYFIGRGTSEAVADSASFFIILVLCFILLFLAGSYTFRYVRLPARIEVLDRIVATLLGLLLGALVAVVMSMVMQYAFVRHDIAATAKFPLTRAFQRSVRGSALRPILLQHGLPRVYTSVSPFLPEAAQPFFRASVATG